MAKAKAKKKAPARKKAVAKKSVAKKRTPAKRVVKKSAAKKPNVISISKPAAPKPDLLTMTNLETRADAEAPKGKIKLWGKKSAPVDAKSPEAIVGKPAEVKAPASKALATKSSARKKTTGNPELAEKIRSWGKKRRLTKDAYLSGLADAIESDEDLVVWASTDVLAVFPHSYASQTPNRIYSALVLIRNVLVFAPVALTWLAISEATSAFAIYTTKETGTVANFLQFWEDGYGYLDEEWTISHVAVLDFQLILAVIVLTLLTELYSNRNESIAEKDDIESERERIGLAVEVMAYLYDKRGVNNVTMNSALARSVQNLRASSKSLNDAAKRIEKVSKSLPNNAAIIQEIRKAGK
jgi:hypothetical protein